MVLSGIVYIIWVAINVWLGTICLYCFKTVKYIRPALVFLLCQLAILATQLGVSGAGFVPSIHWAVIYIVSAAAFAWLYHIDDEVNVLKLSFSMGLMALFCFVYYGLSIRHARNGELNYVFTIGLNILSMWQGVLLYGGARKPIKQRTGG